MDLIWPDSALRSQLPDAVRLCFTTRLGGCSSAPFQYGNLAAHVGDDLASVRRNRQVLLQRMPGARGIQWLEQVHGVACPVAVGGGVTLTADAAFSDRAGLACAVLTADCLPVLFMSRDGTEVAAAHAGWRGLADGVLLQTVRRFSPASSVLAVFGPAIGAEDFEVGAEVREAFAWAPDECFRPGKPGKYMADLYAIARYQLQLAGVTCLSSPSSERCTMTEHQRFYSYRKEGQTGRQASLIWSV